MHKNKNKKMLWCWYFMSDTDFALLGVLNKSQNALLTAQELGWSVAVRLMCSKTSHINEKTDRPWFELGSPVSFVVQYYMDAITLQNNYKMVLYFREVARRIKNIPPIPRPLYIELTTKTATCVLWLQQQLRHCNSIGSEKAFFAFVVHVRWNYSQLKARKYVGSDDVDYENNLFHTNSKRKRFDAHTTWEHLHTVQELYLHLRRFLIEIISTHNAAQVWKETPLHKDVLTKNNVVDRFEKSLSNADLISFISNYTHFSSFLEKYLVVFFGTRWNMRIDGYNAIALSKSAAQ